MISKLTLLVATTYGAGWDYATNNGEDWPNLSIADN